ncbi:MAG: GHKL domain-containing protein [Clostridia bacterium]|nr:GHKL domain-containing protein [Clostridia bacterium]
MTRIFEFALSPLLMAVGQVLAALYFQHDEERDHPIWSPRRVALALGLLAMNTAVQTFLRVSISENPLAPMLTYLMMSLTIYILFARLFSQLTWKTSLFAGLVFLTADNSAWSLINSVLRMGWNTNFLYTGTLAQRLLVVLALWMVELCILMLVKRHLPEPERLYLSNHTLVLIALAAVPFLTIRWFSSQLPAENAKTFQFGITLCFLCQLVILAGYVGRESTDRERMAELQMKRVLQAQQEQFNLKIHNIEAVNHKYHDMKNLLLYLEKGTRDLPEIRRFIQEMEPYEALVSTGNEAVDIILSEKIKICQQEGICCVPYVDGRMMDFMSPLDICTIFGNALDNAMESCRMIKEPENRQISMKTNRKGDHVILVFRNTYGNKPDIRGGIPVSSKQDRENHGFGLKSIRYIAQKYGGQLNCQVEGQEFVLTLLFQNVGQKQTGGEA